jgi:hypothetical protein
MRAWRSIMRASANRPRQIDGTNTILQPAQAFASGQKSYARK